MKVLDPQCDPTAFLQSVDSAEHPVLLLDYDGTLAPFRKERDQAVPYPGVRDLLRDLIAGKRSRVVVISGRSVDDLLPLLSVDPAPEIWGSHGLERLRPDGTRSAPELSETTAQGIAQLRRWIEHEQLAEQAELKPSGAAFHWRALAAPEARALEDKVRNRWADEAAQFGLELHGFDGGLELRVAGVTKADAVRAILTEVDDSAPVAYLGDDRTDEDAFKALKVRGLSVLVRPELRESAADIWITPPEELLEFIGHWR